MKWTPERLSMAKVRRLYREGGFIKVLEACYTIIDKDKRKHTIVLNDEQRDFVKKCELQLRTYGFVRQIILKARQLGFSTIIEGVETIHIRARMTPGMMKKIIPIPTRMPTTRESRNREKSLGATSPNSSPTEASTTPSDSTSSTILTIVPASQTVAMIW